MAYSNHKYSATKCIPKRTTVPANIYPYNKKIWKKATAIDYGNGSTPPTNARKYSNLQ